MQRTLSEMMDRSSSIELKVAEIYDSFSTVFEANQALSNFWMLFAEAERYHSLLIQMQKLGIKSEPDSGKVASWGHDIDEAITYLDQHIERLQQGWVPTIADAFALASDIEMKSLEVQSRSFELMKPTAVLDMLAKLHEEETTHREKLVLARSKFDPSFQSP